MTTKFKLSNNAIRSNIKIKYIIRTINKKIKCQFFNLTTPLQFDGSIIKVEFHRINNCFETKFFDTED